MDASLKAAARRQGLAPLAEKLAAIVPDLSDQYTHTPVVAPHVVRKVRNQHAFQMSLVGRVIDEFPDKKPVIVDIGDSAGTHLQYLAGLYPHKPFDCLSVNLEPAAVERIRAKGLRAILARAEQLDEHDIHADLFLCFETLEHLTDPCRFLHQLSAKTQAKYLILTVPYVSASRVGLRYVRGVKPPPAYAENTHIFELAPGDLKLLARHGGWDVHYEQVYRQYPRFGPLRAMKAYWRRCDFEGFYGLILRRDDTWSRHYRDW
jgi:SAM-dependent methyltransferase